MTSEQLMAYMSRQSCGCLGMATIDNPNHRKEVAREVGGALRRGETVERVTVEAVRTADFYCADHAPAPRGAAGEGSAE